MKNEELLLNIGSKAMILLLSCITIGFFGILIGSVIGLFKVLANGMF